MSRPCASSRLPCRLITLKGLDLRPRFGGLSSMGCKPDLEMVVPDFSTQAGIKHDNMWGGFHSRRYRSRDALKIVSIDLPFAITQVVLRGGAFSRHQFDAGHNQSRTTHGIARGFGLMSIGLARNLQINANRQGAIVERREKRVPLGRCSRRFGIRPLNRLHPRAVGVRQDGFGAPCLHHLRFL